MNLIDASSLAYPDSSARWQAVRAQNVVATKVATSSPSGASPFAAELEKQTASPTSLTPQPVTKKELAPPPVTAKTNVEPKEDQDVEVATWRTDIARKTSVTSDEEFTVYDALDFINPLQHIPVLGTLYREATGDTIKPSVQVAGSLAFGVLTGSVLLSGAVGVASAMIESQTGEEPTIQIAKALFGDTIGEASGETAEPRTVDQGIPDSKSSIQLAKAEVPEQGFATEPSTDKATTQKASIPLVQKAELSDPALIAAQTPAAAAATAAQTTKPQSTAQMVAAANAERHGIVTAAPGAMRVGNTIYAGVNKRSGIKSFTAPTNTAASLPATDPVQAQAEKALAAAQAAAQSTTPGQSVPAIGATTRPADSAAFGAMLQQQAQAHQEGNPLPPALVQDMMLMAMDKYKAAHALVPNAAAN